MSALSATTLPMTISSLRHLNGSQIGENRLIGNQPSGDTSLSEARPSSNGHPEPLLRPDGDTANSVRGLKSPVANRGRSEQNRATGTSARAATKAKTTTKILKQKTKSGNSQAKTTSANRRSTAEIVNDAVNAAFDKSMTRFTEVATKMIDSVKSCTCASTSSGSVAPGGSVNPPPTTSANQSILTQISQELGRGLVSLVREFVDVMIRNVGAESLDTISTAPSTATPNGSNAPSTIVPNGTVSSSSTTGTGSSSVERGSPIYETSGSINRTPQNDSAGVGLIGSVLHFAQQIWNSISEFLGSVLRGPATVATK